MRITRSDTGSIEGSKRALDAATKSALQDTIQYWHDTFLPLHFTEAANDLYGYQPRKGQDEPSLIYSDAGRAVRRGKFGRLVNNPKYYWRKWRMKRTHDPLVFSGQSRQQAEAGIRLSARAINAEGLIRGQGVMDLPRYFYQHAGDSPNKADELTRTTPGEEAQLSRYFGAAVASRVAAVAQPRSTAQVA